MGEEHLRQDEQGDQGRDDEKREDRDKLDHMHKQTKPQLAVAGKSRSRRGSQVDLSVNRSASQPQ